MRNAVVTALVAGLFFAGCGDDTGTGGNQGGSPSEGGGGSTTDGGSPPTNGGGGSTSDGGGGGTPDPVCGDGAVDGGEDCDDDNTSNDDGCDSSCQVEAGYECTGEPSVCVTDCGDGIVTGDEECDDNNAVGQDGCDMLCAIEAGYECDGAPSTCTATCGDGVTAVGTEECDDQNTTAADGCDGTCQIEPGYSCLGMPSVCDTDCGDGVVAGTEECDDNNSVDGDGCSAACAEEAGFDCTGMPSVCLAVCGDGAIAGTEECDDSNTTGGDCCSDTCAVEAGCETEPNNTDLTADDFAAHQVGGVVNGFVDPAGDANFYSVVLAIPGSIAAETLDGILGTTCASNGVDSRIQILDSTGAVLVSDDDGGVGFCSLAQSPLLAAGTYYVVVDASPSDPTLTFDYAIQVTVNDAVCGDGDTDPGEQCDDSNTTSGDGCSATCQVECNNEVDPNDTTATASVLNTPGNANCGAINPIADLDFWTFTTTAVTDVRVETFDASGSDCLGGMDTVIELRAPNGTTILVTNDDGGINACSLINPTVDTAARHLAPGTYFVRVIEFGSNAAIPAYRLGVSFDAVCGNGLVEGAEECDGGATCTATCDRIPVCGDGFIDAPEACDDSNTTNGDGCSSTCQVEVSCLAGATFTESEPNDDGATATATNDFSSTNADGSVCGDILVSAAITPAGDDDVYAISNTTGAPLSVVFETSVPTVGLCNGGADTQIRIRDAAGTQLGFDDDTGVGFCSLLTFVVPANTTVYAHVIDFGDNGAIAAYQLNVNFP